MHHEHCERKCDWNVKVLDSKLAYSRLKNCFNQYLVLVVLGSTTCLSFLPPVGELVKHFSLNVNYLFKDSWVKSLNTNWSSLVHFRNEIWQRNLWSIAGCPVSSCSGFPDMLFLPICNPGPSCSTANKWYP